MAEAPPVGLLLRSLVGELYVPLGRAYLAAERARQRLERIQTSISRANRSLDALRWLAQALESPATAQNACAPVLLAQTLATVSRPTDAITAEFPVGLAVLSGAGVLDAVLDNLLTYARHHRGKRSTVDIVGRVVPAPLPEWPESIELALPRPLVWLTVVIADPAIVPNTNPFDPSVHVGLWLSRQMVRSQGGELWCVRSSRGARFCSLWALAPTIAPDGWPHGRVEFGRAIREARLKNGLTRSRLSQLSGLADTTIHNIEVGHRGFSQNSRERLVEVFAKLKRPGAQP